MNHVSVKSGSTSWGGVRRLPISIYYTCSLSKGCFRGQGQRFPCIDSDMRGRLKSATLAKVTLMSLRWRPTIGVHGEFVSKCGQAFAEKVKHKAADADLGSSSSVVLLAKALSLAAKATVGSRACKVDCFQAVARRRCLHLLPRLVEPDLTKTWFNDSSC